MNNKGFTLVELLAVIIILSLLAILASTSVSKIVKDSKNDLYDTQINLIKSAAEAWGADNLYDLPDDGTCKYLTLRDLKQYGLIDSQIKDPRTNELFPNKLLIKITGKKNSFGLNNVTYEVDSTDIENCQPVVDSICYLVSGKPNEIGSKYQCAVKDKMEKDFNLGYYFFVLSHNSDGTANLIMERNIYYDSVNDVGLVATSSNANVDWGYDNRYGPVTAMDYLYNSTKDWNNLPDIEMNYMDEGNIGNYGYKGIKTTNGLTQIITKDGSISKVLTDKEGYGNLKARMPYLKEVNGKDPKEYSYLYDYLELCNNIQINSIEGIKGYWTLSSVDDEPGDALGVECDGSILSNPLGSTNFGVRPVITLKL